MRRWPALVLLAAIALTGWACRRATDGKPVLGPSSEEADGPALFENVTASSGVDITYRNGEEAGHFSILESLGGGAGVIDHDGDGLLDLFVVGGGEFTGTDKKDIVGLPCKLYRNLGNNRFKDVTAEVGLDKLAGGKRWFYTHGVAVCDYDRDGRPDLLITGWGRVALFRNVDGKRFEDVSARAGLDKGITWATSAAWADLDGDGWPDLYLCQYVDWSWQNHPLECSYGGKVRDVCPPAQFSGLTHKVFRNNGDGTFSDVSATCGLVPGNRTSSKGLGVLAVDINADGKPDLYVCNDTVDKFLYVNVSTRGKIRFEEHGLASGAARDDRGNPNGSMGVDAGDPDGSGKPSLWVTNYENELHGLYSNQCERGHVFFSFQTKESGVAVIGQKFVGWGTAFIDFDLDGWEDIFVSNGHAIRFPLGSGVTRLQKAVLLLNRGKGKFIPAGKRIGPYGMKGHLGRGVAFADLDDDGRVDMVLNHTNEPTTVLRNVAPEGNHWLGVRLLGAGHADVVGARVILEAGGRTQTRFAKGGGSYLSSSDRRLVFGLGKGSTIDKVSVTWPDGSKQEWSGLGIDRYHTLVQGEEKPR